MAEVKWRLSVYKQSHPRYANGNLIWWKEYRRRGNAEKMAERWKKLRPEAIIELDRFEFMGFAWVCHGRKGIDVFDLQGGDA